MAVIFYAAEEIQGNSKEKKINGYVSYNGCKYRLRYWRSDSQRFYFKFLLAKLVNEINNGFISL